MKICYCKGDDSIFTATYYINDKQVAFEDLKKYTITKKTALTHINNIAQRVNNSQCNDRNDCNN